MPENRAPLAVGDIIHGYANGAFGNTYDCRRIEAVGPDWIVCRDEVGDVVFATGRDSLKLCQVNREPVTDINDQACCTSGWRHAVCLTTWGQR